MLKLTRAIVFAALATLAVGSFAQDGKKMDKKADHKMAMGHKMEHKGKMMEKKGHKMAMKGHKMAGHKMTAKSHKMTKKGHKMAMKGKMMDKKADHKMAGK